MSSTTSTTEPTVLISPPPDSAPAADVELVIVEAPLQTPDGERLFRQVELNVLVAAARRKERRRYDRLLAEQHEKHQTEIVAAVDAAVERALSLRR